MNNLDNFERVAKWLRQQAATLSARVRIPPRSFGEGIERQRCPTETGR